MCSRLSRGLADLQGSCRGRALAFLLGLALLGCASTGNKAPDTAHQTQPGTVLVVATESVPELKFEGFVRGKAAGAAAGAGGTFAACMGGMGGGACGGAACGALIILLLGVCGIAGLIGGVAGAAAAPSADAAAASEAILARAFEVRTIQDAVSNGVVEAASRAGLRLATAPGDTVQAAVAGKDYRSLANHGVNTVLETTLTEAGTSGAGINSPSQAYMRVRVRLIDTASNAERHAADYLYQGRSLDLAGWSAQQAQPLLDELARGYRTLGAQIYETVFELYPFPDRQAHSAGGALSAAFGLAPIYPPTRGMFSGERYIGGIFEWYAVDGLKPDFKWEKFPRASDMAEAPEAMARVANVTYDFVIASEENMAPADVIYRREGLSTPEHAIDFPLAQGKRYFWTVRARFDVDGRSRVSEWSATYFSAREHITAPSQHSFRFRTP